MRLSWDGDRDPLAALAAGDPGLFEDFVRTETVTLLGFFARLGAPPEDAEDLVQEVFLKLYQHARRYRPSERFAAFALRVARNAWVDRTRRRALRRPAAGGHTAEESDPDVAARVEDRAPEVGEGASARELSRRLLAGLAELSESHRTVFELGAMQELSYAEVGAILDIPVGTVKSRMYHAVRRLRELSEPREQEETR